MPELTGPQRRAGQRTAHRPIQWGCHLCRQDGHPERGEGTATSTTAAVAELDRHHRTHHRGDAA